MRHLDAERRIRFWSALLVVACAGAVGISATSERATAGPEVDRQMIAQRSGPIVLTAVADTWVVIPVPVVPPERPPTPEPAHGREPRLYIYAWGSPPVATEAYVRFDLGDVPDGAAVGSGTFRLRLVEDMGAFPAMTVGSGARPTGAAPGRTHAGSGSADPRGAPPPGTEVPGST